MSTVKITPSRGVKKTAEVAVRVQGLSKVYASAAELLPVLTDIDFELHTARSLAVIGESGSGKSTLLNLVGGLDYASSGSITIFGTSIETMNETELARFRNRHVGFVFQYHHLLPDFSAIENVAMPALLAGRSFEEARETARQLLVDIGLGTRLEHRPGQLSGGEQQRVAIVRALINKPGLVLMDEPTGNLDEGTGASVLDLVIALQKKNALTLVMVTHSQKVAAACDECLLLAGGRARVQRRSGRRTGRA
ncbi:MAG TPA: ABC transporter ATP-binding protein [Spirochaetota bacterium]|nr:ABC transporter ATP-binding protein [Spirochaetota bacterium]HPH01354.1 ABC transporter ATP-binding protein [Spirochaetota bacterium]HPN81763.1 ABC transporter ATP-binding protein [Spirochaetota bacterium]